MIHGVRFKVCGLTSLVDAEASDSVGADYLGFILYPKSPRYVSLAQFAAMAPRLPPRKKVAVVVDPTLEALAEIKTAGFDYLQVHFSPTTPLATVARWLEVIPRKMLWLAPRVPPGQELESGLIALVDHVLLDTYHPEAHGGTGRTGDWTSFKVLSSGFPHVNWILAGGLNPNNIAAALAATGARWVDVNSGIESAPGVKDHAKLQAFVTALRQVPSNPSL
jgi:phosphoribosylanthranilate isomerase